jgi:hypothetical protein
MKLLLFSPDHSIMLQLNWITRILPLLSCSFPGTFTNKIGNVPVAFLKGQSLFWYTCLEMNIAISRGSR